MTDWREVTLADVCRSVDYGYTASATADPDLPRFLRITDIVKPQIDWRAVPGCPINAADLTKFALAEGDIVVARTGATVGYAKRIKSHPDAVFASYLVRFRPTEGVVPGYLGAVVVSTAYKEWVKGNAGGAAQPNANARVLGAYPFMLPPVAVQHRIARVSDALDQLIENNRRRVEVLEKMARAIYREWFVHFRYPGHEDATFVDSAIGPIPERWAVQPLGEVIALNYGKALKADARRGGAVAVLGSSGIVGWHDEAIVKGPAIVVGRKGNVGSISWVDGDAWPIDTTYFVETELPRRFTCEQLRGVEFLNTHAAVPGLSREQAYSKSFLVPDAATMHRFDSTADLLLAQASLLNAQADRLSGVRDLLLPKLVTGQVDVSGLDLDAVVERAAV